ncbi:MAG: T9SS type A sorting domain-containing protein [Candidatus Cloacimonetes bacterium]|nr:T9SS type A sorting domain-containing protein [Candidatus Cloacimonadota bacterium]
MKKLLIVSFILLISSAQFADSVKKKAKIADESPFHYTNTRLRDYITVIEEDFETGAEGWEQYGENDVSEWIEAWHLSTTGAYSGNSWWMGDEDLGGYTYHRYLVLDTPELSLAEGNPQLHFMFSLCCGDPLQYEPYDAGGGANVRISVDDGNTWLPLNGIPEYNASNIYSFGYEFNEGSDIPGWSSSTDWVTWTAASFDLSAFAGDDVIIRFAFASNSYYCVEDDENLFGMRIDNIEIDTSEGTFTSDGNGAPGDALLIPDYGCYQFSKLWHIYEDSQAPGPTHALGCFSDSTDTYLPRIEDYIVSPVFYLPADGIFIWDVYVKALLDDAAFPDYDYLYVEICSQVPGGWWSGWSSISNPTCNPAVENLVFSGNVENWSLFSEVWGNEYGNLSMLAGHNVQMRFGLHSNATGEVVPGGFRIDSFQILQEEFAGPAPENLEAIVNAAGQVELTWDPIPESEAGWLQWDDGVNYGSLGFVAGGTFYVAISFDQYDLAAYAGGTITELEIYIADEPTSMTIYIWEGSMAAEELLNQDFIPEAASWNTIILDTPLEIESGTEYWIGYRVTHEANLDPAGYDDGPAVLGKSSWITTDLETWDSMIGTGNPYNWNIHAFVEDDGRSLPVFPGNQRDLNITGYNILRSYTSGEDYVNIGTIDPANTPGFLDEDPASGNWNFYVVSALYDGEEGVPCDESMVYVPSNQNIEMAYDDGTAEEGYNDGIAHYMGVRFDQTYPDSLVLTNIKVYIYSFDIGELILRIYSDDNGVNGTQLAQINTHYTFLEEGWNVIEVPETIQDDLIFCSESFHIAVYEVQYAPSIGLDTSGSGHSWVADFHSWQEFTEGNFMIRAILSYENAWYGDIDANGRIEVLDASLLLNYTVGNDLLPEDPIPWEDWREEISDVDLNDILQAYDASLILNYTAGNIPELPWTGRNDNPPVMTLTERLDPERNKEREFAISLGSSEGEVNSIVTIPVITSVISESDSIISYQFLINYDPLIIEFNDFLLEGTLSEGGILAVNDNSGELSIACMTTEALTGEGSLMQLLFTGIAEGSTDLVITEFFYNTQETTDLTDGDIYITPADNDDIYITVEHFSIYPNPFNPETNIRYGLAESGNVLLEIYNLKGQKVETLFNDIVEAGKHEIAWNAECLTSGIYYIRMTCGAVVETRKVVLLK